jgi:hypothetical protein
MVFLYRIRSPWPELGFFGACRAGRGVLAAQKLSFRHKLAIIACKVTRSKIGNLVFHLC